ncbi:hypothetical protein HUK80_17550 [Flavobacterium sp. MAH-1]|uniref:Uncharacterized protein n=1 Tax=Flavobacterium agri TaxID=2743471 RepID=A0A7Y9C728_9FLAO|nr:hypothetical protein [Flavobacterium agri]NUY82712.1 hypothetical protein [Flavobacterium agri]NYA72735.1 hypothetical protein [Flavobacterium agri]
MNITVKIIWQLILLKIIHLRIWRNVIPILFAISLGGCRNQHENLEFKIENNYVGICAIFIDDKTEIENPSILLKNGLAKIPSENLRSTMIFKEASNKIIPVLEIGEIPRNHNERYIFHLSENNIYEACEIDEISYLDFFVGTQKEFNDWKSLRQHELDFFNSKSINWCEFLKNEAN